MLPGHLLQFLTRVHGSQRRRALRRIQCDVVSGPFRDELRVHGDEAKGDEVKGGSDGLLKY